MSLSSAYDVALGRYGRCRGCDASTVIYPARSPAQKPEWLCDACLRESPPCEPAGEPTC